MEKLAEKLAIARRISKFNIKHPFPEPKENWGPYSCVQMYRYMRRYEHGRTEWETSQHWFGNRSMSSDIYYDRWSPSAVPPKCLWGMIVEFDVFVGLIRMYEIRLDIPDLRPLKEGVTKVFYSTPLIWKKQDFEVYVDIQTNEIYDKNGNHIRKSDRVFPSVTLDRYEGGEWTNIIAIHRKLVAFKDMNQFYVNNFKDITKQLYDLGYDTSIADTYRLNRQMSELVKYLSNKPTMVTFGNTIFGDSRTYIEKRNEFCVSWGEYRPYTRGNHIVKIPEKYNGKNIYRISFQDRYRSPMVYIVGKDYCIYSSHKDKMRVQDLSYHHLIDKNELSVFSGDPEIGWVSNMEGDEDGKVYADELLRNISNIFYEQLTKMDLLGLRKADRILHGGTRRTGNVLKHYGISKKQAVVLDEYFSGCRWLNKNRVNKVFEAIHAFFSFSETISGEKDFEEIFKQMCQYENVNTDFTRQAYLFKIDQPIEEIPPVERKIIMDQKKKILRFCAESRSALDDTMRMYARYTSYIETGAEYCSILNGHIAKAFWLEVAPNIHSAADFARTHDLYMERCREIDQRSQAQRDADLQKRLAKYEEENKKRKKKWEFSNEKFAIVFPMTVSEVRLEGEALHHCVGGYAQRHIQNETTILFLRKEESPDTSFYTIEIRKDGAEWKVVQVHGACNKWIGNDPDAARFVWHWAKDKGVCLDEHIVLNTSTGYARGATYLPESELY